VTDAITFIIGAMTLVVMLGSFVMRPQFARCPDGWHHDGVRPTGVFSCIRKPVGDDHRDTRGILHDDSLEPRGELWGQLYCTGGSLPVVVDDRVVWCQR
jgi:hypothetical protein